MVNGLRFIIGSACNYDCLFCHHEGYEKPSTTAVMDKKLEMLYEYAIENNIKDISITGGEPFMYWDKLKKLLDLFGNEKFRITLNTNLSLAVKYIDDLINYKNIEYHINFSSLNKDVHEQIIGKTYLEKLINNLELFKLNKQNICLNIPILKGINDNEIIDILNYCKNNNFKARFLVLLPMNEEQTKYFYDVEDIIDSIPNSELIQKYSYGRYDVKSDIENYEIVKCLCIDKECERCMQTTYVHITPDLNLRMCMESKIEYTVDYSDINTVTESFNKVLRRKI